MSQGTIEVMFVTPLLTDVTLVNEDTFGDDGGDECDKDDEDDALAMLT